MASPNYPTFIVGGDFDDRKVGRKTFNISEGCGGGRAPPHQSASSTPVRRAAAVGAGASRSGPDRQARGTTAVASISTRAVDSASATTWTSEMAGKCRPTISR